MAGLPPLHALRAFEAAARHLSFARAAAELNLTPSAISHQIRHLEESLGRRLFERRHRGLELSVIGRVYYPLVRDAFTRLIEATTLIGGAGPELHNVLTISCTPSFAMVWLIPRLPAFQTAHPAIEVRLDTSTRLVEFARDGVDAGIRYGTGEWPGVHAEFLFSETLFPVGAPSLFAAKGGVSKPDDLARFPLIHTLPYIDDWRLWLTAAGATGVDPDHGSRFDNNLAAYKAAEQGLGVAIGRGMLLEEPLAAGRLVAPFEVKLTTSHAYYFVCAAGTERVRKVALFHDWLEGEVAARSTGQGGSAPPGMSKIHP